MRLRLTLLFKVDTKLFYLLNRFWKLKSLQAGLILNKLVNILESVKILSQLLELDNLWSMRLIKGVTITKVANALLEQALSGNTTAMIFYLKTQAGWSEKLQIETTVSEIKEEYIIVTE